MLDEGNVDHLAQFWDLQDFLKLKHAVVKVSAGD